MGAAIPYVLFVFMEVFRHDYRMISKWGAAFPVLSLIAGGIVTLIPRRQANRLICFLVGLSITLFLQLLMQRAVEASPDVLIKGKVVIDGESYARSGVTIRTLPPGREAVILEDGTFVIQLQSERTYQLVAQAPSFSSEIISVDVKRDKNQPVTFRLQKLSPYAPTLPPLKPLPTASGAPP
jgi:hypothetical protein